MGKKKKKEQSKPWCYFCNRVFDEQSQLITHQLNKHFKCATCNKKLSNSKSLAVHSYQVHRVSITRCLARSALHERSGCSHANGPLIALLSSPKLCLLFH